MATPEIQKKCKKCGLIKYLKEFYKHPTHLDGRRGTCKACDSDSYKTKKKPVTKPGYFSF